MALAPEVRSTLNDLVSAQTLSNLLFSGSPGIGKTTASLLIVSQFSCDHQVFYGSVDRGINAVREDLKRFVGARPWPGHSLRVAILEEADGLTLEAQRALRNVMDTAPASSRFILNMNSTTGLHAAVMSRCLKIDLSSPPISERIRVVGRILEAEGVASELPGLPEAAALVSDMRQLITLVELAVRTGVPLPGISPHDADLPPVDMVIPDTTKGQLRLRKVRRPMREQMIETELHEQAASVDELQARLADKGVDVPLPTLYEDLARLQRREVIAPEGYPSRWYVRRPSRYGDDRERRSP